MPQAIQPITNEQMSEQKSWYSFFINIRSREFLIMLTSWWVMTSIINLEPDVTSSDNLKVWYMIFKAAGLAQFAYIAGVFIKWRFTQRIEEIKCAAQANSNISP